MQFGINQAMTLALSVVVGAVAAYYAHFQPYRAALMARIIVYMGSVFYILFRFHDTAGWFFLFRWAILFNLFISLVGAAFGASLALSFKRNRGVRVN